MGLDMGLWQELVDCQWTTFVISCKTFAGNICNIHVTFRLSRASRPDSMFLEAENK